MLIADIFSIAVLVAVLLYVFYLFYGAYLGAPYYPSNRRITREFVEAMKAYPQVHNIVELGAGDGRIAVALARAGYKVTAIEINPFLTLRTRMKKLIFGLKDLQVVRANFLETDFSVFDGAIVYLYPEIMETLRPLLYQQMPKNSVIVSNTFQFKDAKEKRQFGDHLHVYLT